MLSKLNRVKDNRRRSVHGVNHHSGISNPQAKLHRSSSEEILMARKKLCKYCGIGPQDESPYILEVQRGSCKLCQNQRGYDILAGREVRSFEEIGQERKRIRDYRLAIRVTRISRTTYKNGIPSTVNIISGR